jgi:XTP/dITP diphosphohydrolase
MTQKLLVATRNLHKLDEFRDMLSELEDVEWVSLWDVGLGEMDVEETGTTFEENARLKAYEYQKASGLVTFADDSGLEVDALNGEPGVYSARYGGPDITSDAGRYRLLLEKLASVPDEKRDARFVCVIAIALPEHDKLEDIPVVRGTVEGKIGYGPRGENGFGYDPVFELPNGHTIAELPDADKHAISHRGNALRRALPVIRQMI